MVIEHQKYIDEMGDEHFSDAPDELVAALRKKGEVVNLHNDYSISSLQHKHALRKMKQEDLWEAFFESFNGMTWNRFLALMDECERAFPHQKCDLMRDKQHALFWFRHTRVERENKRKRDAHPELYEMLEASSKGLDEFDPNAKFDPAEYEWGCERVEGMKSHRQQASSQIVQKWRKRARA